MSPEQLNAARKSDRKMKYLEYDLKHGKPIYRNYETGAICGRSDPKATIADETPGREMSLDVLLESGEKAVGQIVDEYGNPLIVLLKLEKYANLHRCLAMLAPDERKLIDAMFWQDMTDAQYAAQIGVPRRTVNYRRHCVLYKLRKFLVAQ
jgi:DNA-directed RNA polymerase specialized sigma24 family protein